MREHWIFKKALTFFAIFFVDYLTKHAVLIFFINFNHFLGKSSETQLLFYSQSKLKKIPTNKNSY